MPPPTVAGFAACQKTKEMEESRKGSGVMKIVNDGPYIVSTTYWQTEHARRGLLYLSLNAGTFRLLVPDALASEVPQMCQGTRYVIVTRGAMAMGPTLEILFEDGSDAPYSIHLSMGQVDRLPLISDEGRTDLRFLIYVQPGTLAAEFPARYRRVERLPCLRPWDEGGG